ncbi:MAG: hypothetical protein IJX58_08170 [Clostridia bacterium]|nr:hypothetical protein [Clostridia bacterium]
MKDNEKNVTDPIEEVNASGRETVEEINSDIEENGKTSDEVVESVSDGEQSETPDEEEGVLVLEGENPEEPVEEEKGRPFTYMPRFTEVSEKYRRKGDARIRKRLGIKNQVENEPVGNPDEIKLDPTAEFDADFLGTEDAKTPENSGVDESDESMSVNKTKTPEEELEAAAERERKEIKKLLKTEKAPEPVEEEPEETEGEPIEEVEEEEEYVLPDPDADELKVFEFVDTTVEDMPKGDSAESGDSAKKHKAKKNEKEFSNPIQRDSIKDGFLDSLISIRIRMVASIVFTIACLALEILSATRIIGFNIFERSENYATLGIVDFLLAACVFIMAIPEFIGAVKDLINKKVNATLIPIPLFIVFGLYTLTVIYSGETTYALLGLVFASVVIPVLTASLYRTKADFIAFKMIAQPEDKQVIDIKNTKDHDVENKALDGAVDEYKSKFSGTFTASFISDFFKNSETCATSPKHFALILGIPFGIALVCGVVYFFLAKSLMGAMLIFSLVTMLGCPAFSIISGKVSFFHSQRAALATDSTAIGEDAYESFASVDVFAFDDTDLFGPEDVNLKRFMLYGDRDNMDKVMRQMCALFAAVGGPLDYMFSGIIDNRMRHKTASNIIIEDDGICGEIAGHKICAGSEDYMRRNGIAIPPAATVRDGGISDTIKIMYSAEDGEVNAKFYIRYSFSEEFTSTIPSLREAGVIPLVYTRDPNVSGELLSTLTAGNGTMRVVKLYDPVKELSVKPKESARMVTYGDRLDAAGMIVLAKKHHKFSVYLRFVEICSMAIGITLAIALSLITGINFKAVPMAALWHLITCGVIRLVSKAVFLGESAKKSID